MSKEKNHTGTKEQMDKHAYNIMRILNSIDSHLASLVYETTPSRGFAAGIERAIAQPFAGEMNENKDNALEALIKEEVKKALGDK